MDDLLNKFNALPNKNFLWSMMRYTSVIYQVIHNSKLEIHTPRNSTEYYTYISDKYWAKLIYGLSLLSMCYHFQILVYDYSRYLF